MIYITSESEILNFPKSTIETANNISFRNQITNIEFGLEVEDISSNRYLYRFDLSSIIGNFESGQYDYFIRKGGKVLDRGIAQFDNYTVEPNQYEADNTYIQYNV